MDIRPWSEKHVEHQPHHNYFSPFDLFQRWSSLKWFGSKEIHMGYYALRLGADRILVMELTKAQDLEIQPVRGG
jgi:hypothetical protein